MMDFIKNSSKVRVLVIGDVMLDRYWWGNVSRISPEAPVPIVELEKKTYIAGGAANVAANIAGLGAEAVLVGLVGDDEEADLISETLLKQGVATDFLIKSNARPTTVKNRIIAHNQQIARIDHESKQILTPTEEASIFQALDKIIKRVDIIVFSDYGKGTGSEKFLSRLITTASELNIKVLVDPKGKHYGKYQNATMLTPNRFELAEAYNLNNINQTLINEYGEKMLKDFDLKYLLVTQGEAGMSLFEKGKKKIHLSAETRNVYDVTGAGDTVIACLAVAFGCNANFQEAATFANFSAGLVIEKVGTTAINLDMLNQND